MVKFAFELIAQLFAVIIAIETVVTLIEGWRFSTRPSAALFVAWRSVLAGLLVFSAYDGWGLLR